MTPNARRLIANALCRRLRDDGRGRPYHWHQQRNHVYISRPTNPQCSGPLNAATFPITTTDGEPLLPTHELIAGPEYVQVELLADTTLHTPDMTAVLTKHDHDAIMNRLHPLDDAIVRVFVEHRHALPFHADRGHLVWTAKRCPAIIAHAFRAFALAADVETINPLDAADIFYEQREALYTTEERADPEAIQAALDAANRSAP